MTIDLPYCLHKDHDEEWEITRAGDCFRVYLRLCGGVRLEAIK